MDVRDAANHCSQADYDAGRVIDGVYKSGQITGMDIITIAICIQRLAQSVRFLVDAQLPPEDRLTH